MNRRPDRTRGARRRGGFALLLVLLALGLAAVLAASYLYGAAVKLSSSQNLLHSRRARYLAESGLQHAFWQLLTGAAALEGRDTPGEALGPFYADDTNDAYRFYAVPDAVFEGRYLLVALGTAGNVTQTSSATVLFKPDSHLEVTCAMHLAEAGAILPLGVRVDGDVLVEGNLLNWASILGDATAEGWILDPLRRISGTQTPYAPDDDTPDIDWSYYQRYEIDDTTYAAREEETDELLSDDPLAGGGAITPDNPGGVVWLRPASGDTVRLGPDLDFRGTLVIDGNLELDGANVRVTPVEGFPAVVVHGALYVNALSETTFEGYVVAAKGFRAGELLGVLSRTTINGGLLSASTGYGPLLSGDHRVTYYADRCRLYNFSPNPRTGSVRVIQWYDGAQGAPAP